MKRNIVILAVATLLASGCAHTLCQSSQGEVDSAATGTPEAPVTTTIQVTGPAEVVTNISSTENKEVHFSVGYAIQRLAEPRIGLDKEGKLFVDNESAGRYSTGTTDIMMHMAFEDSPELFWEKGMKFGWGNALSFGVGETDNDNKTYMLGYSWHVSHQAYVSLGYSWTRVPTLTGGFEQGDIFPVGKPLPLDERVEGGWFLSVSYVVAGPDEGLVQWGNRR